MRYSTLYKLSKHVEMVMAQNEQLHYHNFQHVEYMLDHLAGSSYRDYERHQLFLAILFHDIVYHPLHKDNEEKSCEYMKNYFKTMSEEYNRNPSSWLLQITDQEDFIGKASNLIMATKHDGRANTELEMYMCNLDLMIFVECDKIYDKYADNIEKEYRYYFSEKEYIEGRIKFLKSLAEKYWFFYHVQGGHSSYDDDRAKINCCREIRRLEERLEKL